MKKSFFISLLGCCVLASCQDAGLQHYWDRHAIAVEDYSKSCDTFVSFAELSVKAPQSKAEQALDALMDKLAAGNEVDYYIYSEWLTAAYHSILSPCRNPGLFAKFVSRLQTDGIMTEDDYAPLAELAAKDMLNLPGTGCIIPALQDESGAPAPWAPGQETLFLVLNLDCATCVAALRALSTEPGEHIALCFGRTPPPAVPGWQFRYSPELSDTFDLEAAPFWFTVDASGIVVKPMSPAPDYNSFATPENL